MSTISAAGGQLVYIRQIDAGIRQLQYKLDSGDWSSSLSLPVTIVNTDPAAGNVAVFFESDIIVDQPDVRLIVDSDRIQIGSVFLNQQGVRTTITVQGIENYRGFVENSGGYSETFVFNLNVVATDGSFLMGNSGWVGGYSYGKNGSNNYIMNCSSDGPIPPNSGGIVGAEAGALDGGVTAELNIIGCSSSGSIGDYGGGIVGEYFGYGGATCTLRQCWSTGAIGLGAGGIAGQYAGQGSGNVSILKCYSVGLIGTDAGGIIGEYAAENTGNVGVTSSYSRGNIGTQAGGIVGRNAGTVGGTVTVSNCYSTGNGLAVSSGGIVGYAYDNVSLYLCYTSGSLPDETGFIFSGDSSNPSTYQSYSEAYNLGVGWNTAHALTVLNTVEDYISIGLNIPFEFRDFGPSPYQYVTIEIPDIVYNGGQTFAAGSSGTPAIIPAGYTYSILSGGLTINPTTGVISASYPGLYILTVRAVKGAEYSITIVSVCVTGSPPTPTPTPLATPGPQSKGNDFELYTDTKIGRRLVQERLQNPNIRFNSFADYHKYKMALLKK